VQKLVGLHLDSQTAFVS